MPDDIDRDRREFREDFRALYDEVNELRQARAAQAVINDHLEAQVEKLATAVEGLTSAIDRSRGALWVISGASAASGAVISWVASVFFHKPMG